MYTISPIINERKRKRDQFESDLKEELTPKKFIISCTNPTSKNPFSNQIPIIFFMDDMSKSNSNSNSLDKNSDLYFDDRSEEDDDANTIRSPTCLGRYCDHDSNSTNIRPIPERLEKMVRMGNKKNSYKIELTDLIDLGLCYHCQLQKKFRNVSLEKMSKLVGPLEKLRDTIGMNTIKNDFIEQIISITQGYEKNPRDLLHTIIVGPPGIGKTHVVEILAEIYLALGYMSKNIIKKVKRTDLVGKYVGHTESKTQNAIDMATGGILVIDEAYELGNKYHRDSYSKVCIDTINRNLTERSDKFICIIVGYEKDLDECFFSYNPGLRSRFKHKYTISEYTPEELEEIFCLKVKNDGWSFDPSMDLDKRKKFFIQNKNSFTAYGRTMESLLFHTKIAHSNRVFFELEPGDKKISLTDIKKGLTRFLTHDSSQKQSDLSDSHKHMYN